MSGGPGAAAGVGLVHHLALAREWEAALAVGEYRVSTLGARLEDVGFLHASFAHQLPATAARSYASVDEDLVVLVIDTARTGCPVRVEGAPGGEAFPHLYGPLPTAAVVEVRPARMVAGRLVVTSPG